MFQRPLIASGSAVIENPITDIFALLSDPVRVAAMTPNVALIGNVEPLATGGFRYHVASRWHGVRYRMAVTTDQFQPPHSIAFSFGEAEWGLPARLLRVRISDRVSYALTEEDENSTRVDVTVSWPNLSVFTVWLYSLFRDRMMAAHLRRIQGLVSAES